MYVELEYFFTNPQDLTGWSKPGWYLKVATILKGPYEYKDAITAKNVLESLIKIENKPLV